MSESPTPAAEPHSAANTDTGAAVAVIWSDQQRQTMFDHWLGSVARTHALRPETLALASTDASFRRYLRIADATGASWIIMDAPPAHEDCAPFVRVAQLMQQAGLRVPRVHAWDQAQGFMLLDDLGPHTMMQVLNPHNSASALPLYVQATQELVTWQLASRPGVLPAYDRALLLRELALLPNWYILRHRNQVLDAQGEQVLAQQFELIVTHNLAAPSVYVHRDFMPRNLMLPHQTTSATNAAPDPRLGVLDFQDAVYGPISYDIASLMRDAFISWDEEFVLDVSVRYWERARRAGLMDFEGWHSDFGAFWRALEWMGLQRHLKVAGIFARLTLRDGKPKYLADTPRFIGYIRATCARYRELTPLLRLIDQLEGTRAC